MQPDSGIKTWQWVVTIIVIIVLIVIGIMVFGNKSVPAPLDTPSNTNTTTTQGANSILVSDQYPGNVVYLSSVTLQAPGWAAVQKDSSGTPGAIIGTVYIPAGISPAKVTVTQPIVDGGTYYAVLYSDNGDSKFDATTDLPLKDASGNVIMRVFHGSASAGENIKG